MAGGTSQVSGISQEFAEAFGFVNINPDIFVVSPKPKTLCRVLALDADP
jgi:hypothetical protein